MLEYASEDGPVSNLVTPISVAILALRGRDREGVPLADLINLQRELAAAIAPAKPRTIALIQQGRKSKSWWYLFAPIVAMNKLVNAAPRA